jgi:hypothetical protein
MNPTPNLFQDEPPAESGRKKTGPPFPPSGPEGETCGSCDHLLKEDYHNRIYYKCDRRGSTRGPGTDVRLKWRACMFWSEYQPKC